MDWRITLYCLAPDFVAGADEARRSLARVRAFLAEEAADSSSRSGHYCDLFDSWLERAEATGVGAGGRLRVSEPRG